VYAAVLVVALAAWHLRHLLLLVFAAVLVATLLVALAEQFSRYVRLGPRLALVASVVTVGAVLAGGFATVGNQLSGQLQDLAERVPAAWATLEDWLGRFDLERTASDLLYEALPPATNVAARLGTAASVTVGALANLVIVVAGGIYLAAQPDVYRHGLVKLVSPERREAVDRGVTALGGAVRRWLAMQLAAMAIVGTVTGLAMWALGVPSPLALGVIAGLLEFVPILGPLLAAVPAVLVAFSVSPELALWVAGTYVVIQQLEGYVLTPLLAKQAVQIPPALMLFALVAFAALFGIAGGLLAAPLMVVVYVAVREFYVAYYLERRPLPAAGEDR
jgi:predicted PurR-regulated permease PerM